MRRPLVALSVLSLAVASLAVHTPLSASTDPIEGRMMSGFGAAVAVAGDAVLVAEVAPKGTGGVVHIYRRSPAGLWRDAGKLVPSESTSGDGFGSVIAADANTALVSWHMGNADSSRGGVLAFRKAANGSWSSAGTVGPDLPVAKGQFGSALAISGDYAFVGATAELPHGNVHLFHRTASGWDDQGTLTFAPGTEPGAADQFGRTIAVDGDWLAVAAPFRETKGAVYLYHRNGSGKWVPESALLTGRNVPSGGQLGLSLHLEGSRLYAGAPVANSSTGMVVVFERNATTGSWAEARTLLPFDGGPARFGSAIGMAGGELWVSAPASNKNIGAVYRMRPITSGGFSGVTRMADDSATGTALYGNAMAFGASVVAVAMPLEGGGLGTVVFYNKTATGGWVTAKRVFLPAQEFAAVTGAEAHCAKGMVKEFQCSNTSLMSFLPISAVGGKRGTELNDNWGWTDPKDGREYALIGRSDGTSFVDITDPVRPRYLGDLPLTAGANSAIWRDIKVYKDFAFIVADGAGPHGMQVFNLAKLRGVKVPKTYEADYVYRDVASVHNIVINEQSGFAYAVGANSGGTTCGGGLHMIDIHDPMHPTFVGCFQDTQTGNKKTGYSHDAQCVMYHGPDARYTGHEICIGSNETAISVGDVTDKKHPVAVSHASYPDVGYTHQAWFGDDQKYLYVDDELDEMNGKGEAAKGTRTLVWDLSKLDDPVLLKQYIGVSKSIDHNLYVKGNRIYQANYTSGLRILDISDPVNPREVGFFDTFPDGDPVAFDGAWSNYPYFKSGTIIVTSIGQGVFFVKDRSAIVP